MSGFLESHSQRRVWAGVCAAPRSRAGIDYLYDEEGIPYAGVCRSADDSSSPVPFTMITNNHGYVLDLLDANGDTFASYRYTPEVCRSPRAPRRSRPASGCHAGSWLRRGLCDP